jgi:hypothetical protein
MGLFDWLTGRKGKNTVATDRIWLTKRAKIAGIQKELAEAIADPAGPRVILVVAHFKDCLEELRTAVAGLDPARVLVTLADAFDDRTSGRLALDQCESIFIVVGERHPLPSHDAVIEEYANSLPCRCRLVHYLSLEDPFLLCFAGEWMEGVLRNLGMKDGECIESRMISRRIRSSQQKIAKVATADRPADSAEEWFERNSQ